MISFNTKFVILYILLFLLILPFVILVGGTIPYFLFYILFLSFLIPFIHSSLALKGIVGSVNIPEGSLYKKDTIIINYKLENKSYFNIPFIEIKSNISKELTGKEEFKAILSLDKRSSYFLNEEISFLRRGFYDIREVEILIHNILKFFFLRKKIATNTSLLIYPEVIPLSNFEISSNQQLGELLIHNKIFQDKSRISSLRDYHKGDLVKSIHWKLTAKKDAPIVKEYESRVDSNLRIFIDNQYKYFANDFDRHMEDKIVDVALSIINYCLNQNMEVLLQTQSSNDAIDLHANNPKDIKAFLDLFARFKGNGILDSRKLLMANMDEILIGSSLIILTTSIDKEIGSIGLQLKIKNLNPLFIVITDLENNNGFIDPAISDRLNQEGIPLIHIDCAASAKGSLEKIYG